MAEMTGSTKKTIQMGEACSLRFSATRRRLNILSYLLLADGAPGEQKETCSQQDGPEQQQPAEIPHTVNSDPGVGIPAYQYEGTQRDEVPPGDEQADNGRHESGKQAHQGAHNAHAESGQRVGQQHRQQQFRKK